MQNSKLNYIAGWAARCRCRAAGPCGRDAGGGGGGGGVMHVGEVPRYKQIDPTTSELIALQADELHYKPKVCSIHRILSTLARMAYLKNHTFVLLRVFLS